MLPSTFHALRLPPSHPYTPSSPAPPTALQLLPLPLPTPTTPTTLLIRVHATTVIRDNLSWPELYARRPAEPAHMGNDYAGTVVGVHAEADARGEWRVGDAVCGMLGAEKGGAWAEYVLADCAAGEVGRVPEGLGWGEAAAVPLSGMTGEQAVFEHGGLRWGGKQEGERKKRVLVTGAAGGVGMFVVGFAVAAGCEVVGAVRDEGRDGEFVRELGVAEVIEYADLESGGCGEFDLVIDTVGGEVLRACWGVVKAEEGARLVSVDSGSWDFVREHGEEGLSKGKEMVKALFFIVEPSAESMRRVAEAVEKKWIKPLVAREFPFAQAREAYELVCNRGVSGRGKAVLVME